MQQTCVIQKNFMWDFRFSQQWPWRLGCDAM